MIVKRFAVVVAVSIAFGFACQAGETFQVDTVHSSVVFKVKHMNASNAWGRFNDISGTFSLDPASPETGKLDFKVKAASVDTANPKRDQHLKGPDFLNAVQFPTLSFISKKIVPAGDAYDVTGELTAHGVTKPLTIKVTPTGQGSGPGGGKIAGIETSFTIKRSDFGMTKMVGPVGDDVWVNVSVEGGLKR
jgi:polyisoprenoid-binding protein YceI